MTRELTIVQDGLGFPEAPRWHDGALYFSDFMSRKVSRFDPVRGLSTVAYVPGQPSGLGFRPDGTLLAVSMFDNNILAIRDGVMKRLVNISSLCIGPNNDMVVDAIGRAYVSGFGFHSMYDHDEAPPGISLVLVDLDGSIRPVGEGLLMPNGMVFSADGSTLVIAELAANRLTAYDVSPAGDLSSSRMFADLGDHSPDGICIDAAGAIWAASPLQGSVVRVVEGEGIVDIIPSPVRAPTSCVLGGPDGSTLYVTTAQLDSAESFYNGISAGFIETVEVDVPGFGFD